MPADVPFKVEVRFVPFLKALCWKKGEKRWNYTIYYNTICIHTPHNQSEFSRAITSESLHANNATIGITRVLMTAATIKYATLRPWVLALLMLPCSNDSRLWEWIKEKSKLFLNVNFGVLCDVRSTVCCVCVCAHMRATGSYLNWKKEGWQSEEEREWK